MSLHRWVGFVTQVERVKRLIAGIATSTAGALVGLATMVYFANVVGREVFRAPIPWADELCLLAIVTAVYVVQVALEAGEQQLNVEAAENLWARKGLGTLHRVFWAVSVIGMYGLFLLPAAVEVVRVNVLIGVRTPVLGLPQALPYGVLTGVLGLVTIIWAWNAVVALRRGARDA